MRAALVAAVAGLLVIGSPASAEPLKIPISIYAAGAAADLQSTYMFLTAEDASHEHNPLGRWLAGSPKGLVMFDVGVEVAGGFLLHKWIGKRHPRLERVIYYTAAGVRFGAAAYNYTHWQADAASWRQYQGLPPR